jgi:hypothetical protein
VLARLDCRGVYTIRRFHSEPLLPEFPPHLFLQVAKAVGTYPTIILSDVAFRQDFWRWRFHKLGPTSFTMIVLPIRSRCGVFLQP